MTTARVEFRILGPLAVRVDGVPVPLGGPKQRALLALLLLSANRVVSRERLVEELFSGESVKSADHALRNHVSRLRKAVSLADAEEPRLVARVPGYVLRVEPGELDLARFGELVDEGREALASKDAVAAVEAFRAAEALWEGRPLADLEFEPFIRLEVERLEELRLAAVEERIEAELTLGRHLMLVAELEALAAEHPYRERLRGQLMLALYRSGRQAEALEAFRGARDTLDELGIEPSAELRRLEKAILVQDRALAAPSQPVDETLLLPGPLVPEPSSPFVGRESELAALRSQLERAKRGEGSVVLLASQAGGGKTRLAREVALEAAVMRKGVLQQLGPPQSLYDRPDNLFVATFIGSPTMNLLQGRIERDGAALQCVLGEQRLPLTTPNGAAAPLAGYVGRDVAVGVRPEHLTDPADGPHDRPRVRGRVKLVELLGSEQMVQIQLDAEPVVADALLEVARDMDATAAEAILGRTKSDGALVIARFDAHANVDQGDLVEVAVRVEWLHFFDLTTGRAIRQK